MNGLLFYGTTIAFMLGVGAASLGLIDIWRAGVLGIVSAACAAIFYVQREQFFALAAVVLCVMVCGALRVELAHHLVDDGLAHFVGADVVLEGVVRSEPDHRERSTLLTVDVESVNDSHATGRVLVFDTRHSSVQYGDRVEVDGVLRSPAAFETELGRTFDYPGYLMSRGITHTVSFGEIHVISSNHGSRVVAMLLTFKQRMSESMSQTLLAPESGLALGLLLGEKQALGEETEVVFRDAGLIHIVVLSGYNIALMIAAVMTLLAFFSLHVRTIIGGITIVLFVLMVGPSATVLRAAVMAILILLARVTGNTYAILRALMVAAVGMLVWNPLLLVHDPGFQLSFLATVGLILLAPLLERRLAWISEWGSLKEYAVATISTQIMVTPLLMYSIGAISLVSVVANVAVLPLVPLAMLLSALTGIIGIAFPYAALVVGYPTDLVLAYIIRATELFAAVPYASVAVPAFPFFVVIVAYIAMGGVLVYVSRVEKRKKTRPAQAMPAPGVFPF